MFIILFGEKKDVCCLPRTRHRVVLCVRVCVQKWYSGEELDIPAIMDTWTLQEGFPLVTVEVRGREVRLSQERYLKTDDPSLAEGYKKTTVLFFSFRRLFVLRLSYDVSQ